MDTSHSEYNIQGKLNNLVRPIVLYPAETIESASTLSTQNRQFDFWKTDKEMSGNEVGKSSLLLNSVTIPVLIQNYLRKLESYQQDWQQVTFRAKCQLLTEQSEMLQTSNLFRLAEFIGFYQFSTFNLKKKARIISMLIL